MLVSEFFMGCLGCGCGSCERSGLRIMGDRTMVSDSPPRGKGGSGGHSTTLFYLQQNFGSTVWLAGFGNISPVWVYRNSEQPEKSEQAEIRSLKRQYDFGWACLEDWHARVTLGSYVPRLNYPIQNSFEWISESYCIPLLGWNCCGSVPTNRVVHSNPLYSLCPRRYLFYRVCTG